MAKKVDPEIEALVRDFAEELSAVFRDKLVEALESSVPAAPAKKTKKKARRKTAKKKATKKKTGRKKTARKTAGRKKATKKASSRRKKGEKRSPQELERLTERLYREIKKNPDSRIEQLSASMNVPTKELTLPAKKLIADKRVKTKGQRRGTTYRA